MSLEFIIERNCPFKDNYKNDLFYILDLMQKTYMVKKLPALLSENTDFDKGEIERSRINSGSGSKDQTLKEIADYLDANRHCGECSVCPANSSGLDYGCYNRISYPVSEAFEQTVMENLPSEGTLASHLLIQAMKDFPIISAKGLKDFRRKGFTEGKAAIQKVIKKNSLFSSQKISSDFFLHLLFFSGDLLEVSHMTILLLFFGIIPHSTTIENFQKDEYIKSQIGKSLQRNSFTNLSEQPLIHSMCLSVLANEPLAFLM